MTDIPFKNPGWAGNTGEFELSEEEVRGADFVGDRPAHGGHASGAGTMPYMLAHKEPEAPLFDGAYKDRLEKILSRYPTKQAALLPALGLAQEIRGHVSPASMDEVAEARSGLEAMRRAHAEGEAYELAIIDAYMPGQDGFELAQTVREDPKLGDTKLMMLTSAGLNAPGYSA